MIYTQEEVKAHLKKLEGWVVEDEQWIVRKYIFSNFMKGISFVDEVAAISEAFAHHPLIIIDYKTVTLRLTTVDEGGITAIDIREAQRYNELFVKMRCGEKE